MTALTPAERRYLERMAAGTGAPPARSGPAIAARARTRRRLFRAGHLTREVYAARVPWSDHRITATRDVITPAGRAALAAATRQEPAR